MLEKGLIQVYNTKSNQSNFAPIGLGLRAAGHDLRTLITCFSPHELMDGCVAGAILLKPNLVINHTVPLKDNLESVNTRDLALKGFKHARNAAIGGAFDIVILNGIHSLLRQGIVSSEDLLGLCQNKATNVELVFSGSNLPEEIMEKAHLVTEMVVRHHPARVRMEQTFAHPGLIEVVTGEGKGKTTYCLGKAMLMSSMGISSFILQVIKSPKPYGEVMAIERLPNLTIRTMGRGFLRKKGQTLFEEKHKEAAKKAWEVWLREIYSMKYGLLVLDEINVATHYGLIRSERVEEMLFLKPPHLHLLLSGRNAHPDVMKEATTVIEMREVKHPYYKGIKARKGIEF
ncbi:MAG: cob(I)yrinic acid a,c-diamide adenosyltransferase [Deltaproteobacteria bacterium]|nr:cob(I)yrinic acid a,c-diamide adenosyltransferase [Deltaproteobacteria bacterium]MBW1929544.1 cob(I)yrinic acid a,c-diamide adenosyltransferase [Deltaproteobacteria bacterium]MBW2024040.1 cob(I)yrinic acid a,c-diamide adenosyltransferase [Deltaproteobacteria bacterium]MBW2124391.1 cob(I)yrinic acid a,c-diamide adenosyltransferase [Deltaproteobacteria bacterium]RLB21943.1 MAG: hypothetical protein DRG76_07900 [Deltaproteobacteria bacterium]